MSEIAPVVGTLIGVAVLFDFVNGFHDSSNVVATIISSRAMSPRMALALSAVAHFCAPFLFGVAVATTIGHDIVDPTTITISVILVALSSAIIWNLVTWFLGIPSSSSHALIGGIVGAVSANSGLSTIKMTGLEKVLVALFLSPILGLLIGYLFMKLVLFLARGASPKINWLFKRLQIVTSLALALSHGTNDAQKTMGIITMGLVTTGYLPHFIVPWWVILVSALALSLGTALGGWRIIKTLGTKIYRIRPIHGFTSQATSALVILGAALLGGPVSTTHVVSSAIMGVGSAERLSKVRWGVAGNIFTAWVVTIPVTALMAALFCVLLNFFR
ncbi:MAG: inorganic phosphate transporter [Anaerolineales bacterium]|nr:MAG: inorganic phosphate transporter [Anaerolineales bacterium]